jgi:hypothetical protein
MATVMKKASMAENEAGNLKRGAWQRHKSVPKKLIAARVIYIYFILTPTFSEPDLFFVFLNICYISIVILTMLLLFNFRSKNHRIEWDSSIKA